MTKITIDNKEIEALEGDSILQAASKAGIDIPAICFNEELTPLGSCRVCVVELSENGNSRLVTSCNTPAGEGMEVKTKSSRVANARNLAIQLLLAQSPQSSVLKMMARKYRVPSRPLKLEANDCILCQLCVRTCREVTGTQAITFVAGGPGRNEKPHIEVSQEKCIACGSCAYICPTEAITARDQIATRIIETPSGVMEFELHKCGCCGNYYWPEKQLEYMAKTSGVDKEKLELCLNCRP